MQAPADAVAELRRAVDELGLLGAYVGTDPGRPLDDPAFDRVYEACVELDVPLFLHPAPGGIDAPRRDERLARFDGDLWLGFEPDDLCQWAADAGLRETASEFLALKNGFSIQIKQFTRADSAGHID